MSKRFTQISKQLVNLQLSFHFLLAVYFEVKAVGSRLAVRLSKNKQLTFNCIEADFNVLKILPWQYSNIKLILQ